jgi:hypothetical protein
MKTLLTLLLISICSIAFGQTIGKKGFEYIITGLVEVDGHSIKNDTCKTPFKFIVDLKESKIVKGKQSYLIRECEKPNCEIIHLEKRSLLNINSGGWYQGSAKTLELNNPDSYITTH